MPSRSEPLDRLRRQSFPSADEEPAKRCPSADNHNVLLEQLPDKQRLPNRFTLNCKAVGGRNRETDGLVESALKIGIHAGSQSLAGKITIVFMKTDDFISMLATRRQPVDRHVQFKASRKPCRRRRRAFILMVLLFGIRPDIRTMLVTNGCSGSRWPSRCRWRSLRCGCWPA